METALDNVVEEWLTDDPNDSYSVVVECLKDRLEEITKWRNEGDYSSQIYHTRLLLIISSVEEESRNERSASTEELYSDSSHTRDNVSI